MKVLELLEDWNNSQLKQQIGSGPMATEVAKQRKAPNHQYVGSGASAYVGRTATPHEMDRVQRTAPEKEGGMIYLRAIANMPDAHNNPFLPRVHATPAGDGGIATYQMERLVAFQSRKIIKNEPLIESLWEQYFTIPFSNHDDIASEITNNLDDIVCYDQNTEIIRDPALREALLMIAKLARTHNLSADIHSENVMWRMTGNMPQLVITDPLT